MLKLTLQQLCKHYSKNKIAVHQISENLTTGVYGLLGANGAGKTTLLRMICGLLHPSSGTILLNGENIFKMGERYRDIIGYLPQDFGYYPDFKAEEFLWYIGSLKGLPLAEAKLKTADLLRLVALEEVARKKIRTFSGGMKQRLGIAQALLNDPRILVLDEPTAGLDPKERVRFRTLISDLAKDKIVILSTHIVSDIEYIADQILVMKQSELFMSGSVEQLIATMNHCVWSCCTTARDAEIFALNYNVSNLRHDGDHVELRIISGEQPREDAVAVSPTLEDFYLYHFQDEKKSTETENIGGHTLWTS